jgi:hypothetical protein
MITNNEFFELLAEEQINPRSEERADLRNAITSATIANAFGGKGADPMSFMPKFDVENNSSKTQEDFDSKMVAWQNALNKVCK